MEVIPYLVALLAGLLTGATSLLLVLNFSWGPLIVYILAAIIGFPAMLWLIFAHTSWN